MELSTKERLTILSKRATSKRKYRELAHTSKTHTPIENLLFDDLKEHVYKIIVEDKLTDAETR